MKAIGVGVVALLCVSLVVGCGSDAANNDGGGTVGADGGTAGAGGGAAGSGGGAAGSGGGAAGSGGAAGTGVIPGGRTMVSCNQAAAGTCFEYVNYPQESADPLRMTCTTTAGTPGSACARTNAVGVCTTPTENEITLRTVYYPPTYSASQVSALQMVCTLAGGTWSPT
jgi:hypothetical protein